MRRNKPSSGISGGDWSDTGTFVRKPATGWLHKDSDLANGAYVKYRLSYLGCTVVMESMRSLKYELRTMATREAITRLAEYSERIQPNKKRKSPKQVGRLLGDINARWANEVNLCIDTEQLQIVSPSSGRELMTHSLTTISFASGGEGVTQDFVGYVAKDPINDRACHVFHCPGGTAQLVLASLGQAFELRYKMYLNTGPGRPPQSQLSSPPSCSSVAQNPPPPPLPRPLPEPHRQDSFTSNNRYSSHNPPPYRSEQNDLLPPKIQTVTYENHGRRQLPAEPPPLTDITHQIHVPLPPPPSIPPQSLARPRVYSSLPGFPEPESNNYDFLKEEPQYEMEDNSLPLKAHPGAMGTQRTLDQLNRPMSYNPYDTMPEEYTLPNPNTVDVQGQDDKDHDYDSVDEGEEEATYDVAEGYEDNLGNQVDNTFPPAPDFNHQGAVGQDDKPTEEEYQLITIHQKPSFDREDQIDLTPAQTPDMNHVYSNLQEEIPQSPEPTVPDYDEPDSLQRQAVIQPTSNGDYEDPDTVLQASLSLDEPDCPPPPYPGISPGSVWNRSRPSPAFDDSIYSTPDVSWPDVPEKRRECLITIASNPWSMPECWKGQSDSAVEPAPVNSLAPLHLQSYFHGRISRADAEFLMQKDGDFLVRESSNKPGQYVLTGLANGRSQHLLLIDKSGKIKSKDREFDSIPHLVKFFYERATSLTIGNCEVYLSNPVTVKQ